MAAKLMDDEEDDVVMDSETDQSSMEGHVKVNGVVHGT